MYTETPAPKTTKENAQTHKPQGRKFMFDVSFDNDAPRAAPERRPVLMKPEQMDQFAKENFDIGFAEGHKVGHEEQTRQLITTMNKIETRLSELIAQMAIIADAQFKQAREIAMAVVAKILPATARQNGLGEISQLIEQSLRDMLHEPRLVVRVNDSEFEAINIKIEEISARHAYSGKIVLLADTGIARGDCRIEWADGGVERNQSSVLQAVSGFINPDGIQQTNSVKDENNG